MILVKMNFKKVFIAFFILCNMAELLAVVPLYRVFEHEIKNGTAYENKFTDVQLIIQYQSPSGRFYNFFGFYDGDGEGGLEGNIWKMRFMPDEIGRWTYIYNWSDGTKGGKGTFECSAEEAGKGILRAYEKNPHWLAYNGTEPVWLKSYYETGHGSIGQNFNWIKENVYLPFIEAGYNHLQVNWLLSLCCFEQYYKDGPEPETTDLFLYEEGDLFGSMNLDVWKRMELHLGWLNDHDIGVHMFLGVDGSKNNGPDWNRLSIEEKKWFVKYMVSRLAPYANVAGWNFVWEVPGDRESHELGFARLVKEYDIFNHLRTYEDEMPRDNEYHRIEYSFAAIENHEIASNNKKNERHLWKEPWLHHMACLLGYQGKPVFMSEGNALWNRFWQKRTKATQDDLRRSAWACATAGASFTWCGHAGEEELYAFGPVGLPLYKENPYHESERYISILTNIMNNEIAFFTMKPHDELLSDHPALEVYAMADPGNQYLVFSPDGSSFSLLVDKGNYTSVKWIDVISGDEISVDQINVENMEKIISFDPPNSHSDWVLILRN